MNERTHCKGIDTGRAPCGRGQVSSRALARGSAPRSGLRRLSRRHAALHPARAGAGADRGSPALLRRHAHRAHARTGAAARRAQQKPPAGRPPVSSIAITVAIFVAQTIFSAGGLYFLIKQIRKDLNGMGMKLRSVDERSEDRYLTTTAAIMMIAPEDKKATLLGPLLTAGKGKI